MQSIVEEQAPALKPIGMLLEGARPRPKAEDSASKESAPRAATATRSRWKFFMACHETASCQHSHRRDALSHRKQACRASLLPWRQQS